VIFHFLRPRGRGGPRPGPRGGVWGGPPPAGAGAAGAAARRSALVWKRRSGAFSSAFASTASSPLGRSGRTEVSRGGSSDRWA
jgi:hypothetical protein